MEAITANHDVPARAAEFGQEDGSNVVPPGVHHIAIVSGDHDAPTRALAESLGMDRYFAQVLPADKADYVAKLQAEGRRVCFVGNGINDSIALKKADVSVSLRGASSLATDTAQVVFLEGDYPVSANCDRSRATSTGT